MRHAKKSIRQRGLAAPAALFALAIAALVAITIFAFAAGRYAAPAPISDDARAVDAQFHLTLALTGAIFAVAQLGLAFAVIRFRDRGQRARFVRGSYALEACWTLAAIILFIGLGVLGRRAWAAVRYAGSEAGSVQIEVTEVQFQFMFRYPGADGQFGRLDPGLISAATGNPLGLDPDSPAGKDDIVTGTLAVPVNRRVELLIRSQDVVHNFFVRELRLQQDAVPGLTIPVHFTADRIGRYDIVCTQLCGLGHQKMHAVLAVMSESDYENFLRQQAAAQ